MQEAVTKSCDPYLEDLQEFIQLYRGKDMSTATVWRTLDRAGFTMKKVCALCCVHVILLVSKPGLGYKSCNGAKH
jgi:hypothetical protein